MVRDATEVAADNAAVVARLVAALQNPGLSDMALVSECDGTSAAVPAFLLASCSPVFKQMLTGPFAESTNQGQKRRRTAGKADSSVPEVSCAFSGQALVAAVSFAATNDSALLLSGTVEDLSDILEVATYCDISGLLAKAVRQMIASVYIKPAEACATLMSVWGRWKADDFDDGPAGKIAKAALMVIDGTGIGGSGIGGRPGVGLMNCDCLCEEAMKFLLCRQSIVATGMVLFEALQRWLAADEKARASAGVGLVACLSLEKMPAAYLRDVVSKSGLMPVEKIIDIFQARAIAADSVGGPQHFPSRAMTSIRSSRTGSSVLEGVGGVEFVDDESQNDGEDWEISADVLNCSLQRG